ncbi:hypothetical protein [Mucilaginibacter sp. HD30]
MGKSHLLMNIALDDIHKGHGVCVLDPHSDTIEAILRRVPEYRKADVVYFNAADANNLPTFNPLHGVPEQQRQLVASEMITTFRKLFLTRGAARWKGYYAWQYLRCFTIPQGPLLDIHALLVDIEFRLSTLMIPTFFPFGKRNTTSTPTREGNRHIADIEQGGRAAGKRNATGYFRPPREHFARTVHE